MEARQAAVFHSFTASVLVDFDRDPGDEQVAAAFAAHPLIEALDAGDRRAPVPTAAAGSKQVLLGPVTPAGGRPGRYWIRAVMDNLTRGGAVNALEIAAAVLGRAS